MSWDWAARSDRSANEADRCRNREDADEANHLSLPMDQCEYWTVESAPALTRLADSFRRPYVSPAA